jgi:Na+/H+ antiporter NhaD/arsenite permease-like protein
MASPASPAATVILTTGILSAFLVNDIVCLVMTPLVVQLTRRFSLPALPYVIAVATASNIGSVATITGNPQNILIGSLSQIPYVAFLVRLGPVALIGLVVNWGVIRFVHRRTLCDIIEPRATGAIEASGPCVRNRSSSWRSCSAGFLAVLPPALACVAGRSAAAHHAKRGTAPGLSLRSTGVCSSSSSGSSSSWAALNVPG